AGRAIPRGTGLVGSELVLIDTRSGRRTDVYHERTRLPKYCTAGCAVIDYLSSPAWSSDGKRVFFVIYDQETGDERLGEYVLATHQTWREPIPVRGAYAPITFDRAAVRGLLR